MKKLSTISEVCEILGLIEPKTKKPLNHVIRYWEKEFKQIKPIKINNRRYYDQKNIDILIDLNGYTLGNRLNIFANRVASIQILWLGYCNSTGLKNMDYII